jgi:hypothetical protein
MKTNPSQDSSCQRYSNGSRRGAFRRLAAMALVAALALSAAFVLVPAAFAQADSHITGVDPGMGKVDDQVTLSGANLGKGKVVAILLSDDKNDYKATMVSQADDKIVIKIPKVKAGGYNISIQDAKTIMIMPVRFTVTN